MNELWAFNPSLHQRKQRKRKDNFQNKLILNILFFKLRTFDNIGSRKTNILTISHVSILYPLLNLTYYFNIIPKG